MSDSKGRVPLPPYYFQLQQPGFSDPTDAGRPNRLCVCISDIHFTDGTVGTQSAEETTWDKTFDRIRQTCSDEDIRELHLILVGDVADMLRSGRWAENGVYPWEEESKPQQFRNTLAQIMQQIILLHGQPGDESKPAGFFYQLRNLVEQLQTAPKPVAVQLIALLGNHDRPLLADDAILQQFYEHCLGQPIDSLSAAYRQWINDIYGATDQSVPWPPFYWGDPGFRLFVTHGHWRDQDNCRAIPASGGKPAWKCGDGWRAEIWHQLGFAPFREACFGDSVAAGMLSGFIYRTKQRLQQLEPAATAVEKPEIRRIDKILDELDLYRPSYLAVDRIIVEIRRLRASSEDVHRVREIIEHELLNSANMWLGWQFTLDSAPASQRLYLRIARWIARLLKLTTNEIELGFLDWLMKLLAWLQADLRSDSGPTLDDMKQFPAFLDAYREYGFRIHGEGHTHVALQEELYFNGPTDRKSYTYINFGAWRNQVVSSQPAKYRRRGIGRALWVLDQLPAESTGDRRFSYWVDDLLSWDDKLDRL